MTRFACIPLFCILTACTSTPVSKPAVEAKPKVSIDQFYSPTPHIEKGGKATLCYGVTFAREVALAPAAANVWPAVSRCVDVTPAKSTTYSLTAKGAEGDVVTKTALVEVGPPHAKIFDIWASGVDQQAGQPLRICFKTENVVRVTVSAGKFDAVKNCVDDNPMKSTSYKISVFGAEGEPALGQVDVKVHP